MTLTRRGDDAGVLHRHTAGLASQAEMMTWISDVVSHGIRRPGSEPGRRVEDWCASQFVDLGLKDVREEAFDVPVWEPGNARLVAWQTDQPERVVELAGFPLPYTQPTKGHEADLVLLDLRADDGSDVEGSIAIDMIELAELPPSYMAEIATGRVDPSGDLDDYVHVLPFSGRLGREVDSAVDAGASGYVGVLAGMPWDTRDYYVPYDAVDRPLPGLWVDRAAGAELSALLAHGPVRGRIEVDARRGDGRGVNVVGTLPGDSDEWVVIGSHHDAPWASAVEDGTGIALVLAQARFWAKVPADERPHNLLFLLNGAHMAGSAGFRSFLERHQALLERIVLAVHLEHAAAACRVEDGRLVATDEPEVRWWFTSQDPVLEEAVAGALTSENLGRSWVLPPEVFGTFPPTDGGYFHVHGVPLVNFLSAPVYLFDACDTLDKVHQPSLVPISRATIRIVESLNGRSAAGLRADRAAGR
jgi:hypothetical protein